MENGTLFYSEKLGCWRYQYYDTMGARHITNQYKGESKTAFKARVTEIKNSLNNGTYIAKNNITVYQLGLEIVENKFKRNKINEASYSREIQTLNHVKNSNIKNMQIQKITSSHLQNFIDDKKIYANSYIDKIFEMLGRIFKEAVKQDYILKNPMLIVEKPKSDKLDEKIEAFSIEEQTAFLNTLNKDKQYKNIFTIALYTGMRMGEILALKKDDIDFTKGIINIKRSLTKDTNGKTKLGDTTKTYNSTRTIPITPLFEGALKNAIANMTLNINGLIFIQASGELYSVSNMNSRFKRLCTNAGLGVVPYTIKRRKKGNTL